MKILIIPEDPTLDSFILKPVIDRLFASVGLSARIEVLRDPHLRGVDQTLDANIIKQVIDMNPMVDLFCIVVDLDCDRQNNSTRSRDIVKLYADRLVACLAVHEIEVWMLALFDHDISWQTIRADCDPKERYAEPFLSKKGWTTEVGHGRKRAMREISTNWNRLTQRCPELQTLASDIQSRLAV